MTIKIITLFVLASFIAGFTPQSGREFVCMPCGNACDGKVYKEPGTCSGCGMKLVEKSTVHFTNLTVDEFCSRIDSNPKAVILDVRSPAEFKGMTQDVPTVGHFRNAININIVDLEKRLGELAGYKSTEILVYCSHSHRSPQVSYTLGTNGFKDVKNMSGGVSTFAGKENDKCLKKSFVFHSH